MRIYRNLITNPAHRVGGHTRPSINRTTIPGNSLEEIFTICDPEAGEQAYNEWIKANPGIRIQTKHICPHGPGDRLYVFYELGSDTQYRKDISLIEESAQLEMCKDIAKSLKMDPDYKALTNKAQRRAYLLDVKNIPSGDADLVAELMSPQLSKLIGGEL